MVHSTTTPYPRSRKNHEDRGVIVTCSMLLRSLVQISLQLDVVCRGYACLFLPLVVVCCGCFSKLTVELALPGADGARYGVPQRDDVLGAAVPSGVTVDVENSIGDLRFDAAVRGV